MVKYFRVSKLFEHPDQYERKIIQEAKSAHAVIRDLNNSNIANPSAVYNYHYRFISWWSHMTYDEFISAVICKTPNDSLRTRDIICIIDDPEIKSGEWNRETHSIIAASLCRKANKKYGAIAWIGSRFNAHFINIGGGHRRAQFQLVGELAAFAVGDTQNIRKISINCRTPDDTKRFDLNDDNSYCVTIPIYSEILSLTMWAEINSTNNIVKQYSTSNKTTETVYIQSNSFQEHVFRAIKDTTSTHRLRKVYRMIESLLKDKYDDIAITYDDSETGSRIRKTFSKKDNKIKDAIQSNEFIHKVRVAIMANEKMMENVDSAEYYAPLLVQSEPSWKSNLERCLSGSCKNSINFSFIDKLINKHHVSSQAIFGILQSKLRSICNVGDNYKNTKDKHKSDNKDRKSVNSEQELPDVDVLHVNVQCENDKLNEKIKRLEEEKDELELENSKLTLQLRSVCDFAINGAKSVNWAKIDLNKVNINNNSNDHGLRTKKCQEYKDILNKLYNKEYPNKQWNVEISSDRDDMEVSLFVQFLQQNGESNPMPRILVDSSRQRSCSNSNSNDCRKDGKKWINIGDILEIKTIRNEKDIATLNEQNGLFAKHDIPKYTIISQYCGHIMVQNTNVRLMMQRTVK